MRNYDLSILIPSRSEEYLSQTIADILKNKRGKTEVIVVLDGEWPALPLPVHPDVVVLYYPESIGQRAATNKAVKLSHAKYVMKVDAHCAFDEGFDVKLMEKMKDNYTMVPIMKNLHVFDWVCTCGHRTYQGPLPTKCEKCGAVEGFKKDIVWRAKPSPNSTSYRFDKNLRFKYFGDYKHRPEYAETLKAEGLTETLSLQGSCFLVTREKYLELNICDEAHGSWGQQGTEVACKTWLSGGRVVCNHSTWYAHLFRTQNGFSFPYPNPGKAQQKAREYSKNLFLNATWDKAIYDVDWLTNKFGPVPDWDTSKGVLYYSDGELDPEILDKCQTQLLKGVGENRLVSVTLKPMPFGDNIHLDLPRGYLTMAKQILTGLKELDTDIVFFCEHDVLYHPSHFDFTPDDREIYYYNTNVWKVRYSDGHAVRVDDMRQLSGLCAYRDILIAQYEKIVQMLEEKLDTLGDTREYRKYVRRMGFEPGTHGRVPELKAKSDKWESKEPNIDIRHEGTLTPSRWSPDKFRNKKYTLGWLENDTIPGWGRFKEVFSKLNTS